MSINRKANHPRLFVSLILFMLIIFSVVTPKHALAATLTVNTLLDENDGSCSDGDCSLRDAIQVAASGDTIAFSVTGTILLNSGRLNISKNMSINGPGPESLTVDGNSNGQIFVVFATNNVSISGLTITNGINIYGYGGGMHNIGTCSITNVIFNNNTSVNPYLGGGLYNEGNATLMNVTFSDNSSGGMYNSGLSTLTNTTFDNNIGHGLVNDGKVTLTNVTFSGNTAVYGGGLYNGSSSISKLTNVTFSGNSASDSGGGIYNDSGLTSALMNVTFSGNSANVGGGIFTRSKTTLTNVTFNDNSAGYGGGMSVVIGNFNTLSLTNVTFSGNTATSKGGGISNSLGTSILTNVTFNGNSAGDGGGVYVWSNSDPMILKNSLLAGGSAPTGPDCSGKVISSGYNLFQDISGCTITGDETGNIYGEDPLLGSLGHYGGYTLMHALLKGSPAIDTASPTDPDGHPVSLDQRGVTRPQGLANDMGAFEFVNQVYFWLPVIYK